MGKTINPCTKGIWIWGRPLKGTNSEGQLVNILLMDSEGLSAIDVDANHDSRVLSLVILLCSMFVYNQIGPIDEGALENLSFIINLTKTIQLKTVEEGKEVDYDEYSHFMPYFLWVLRDFSLELEDHEGDLITSQQYLEKALTE